MLHAGLALSRHRLDVHVMPEDGSTLKVTTAPPERDGLRSFVRQVEGDCGTEEVLAVIESMNGARFVHDTLELCGWSLEVADARKVKGLAPLACKKIASTPGCWPSSPGATSCRRSGCPTLPCALIVYGPASASISSSTARLSRIGSTPAS